MVCKLLAFFWCRAFFPFLTFLMETKSQKRQGGILRTTYPKTIRAQKIPLIKKAFSYRWTDLIPVWGTQDSVKG